MFSQLSDKLKTTFRQLRGHGRLSEDNINAALREVRVALLQADVSLEVVRDFIAQVKTRALGREVMASLSPGQAVVSVVHGELVRLMGEANDKLNLRGAPPLVFMLSGLQGAGKTTTVGKLARFLQARENKKVLLASADVYRPAAMAQLQKLAGEVNADYFEPNFESNSNAKPEKIASAALAHARASSADILLLDTAGRLAVDAEMMDEIAAIQTAVKPLETLYVVDSMAGQDAVHSARAFHERIAFTGVVLTKTDGDARGGAALSIRQVTGKPIKFLGVGEAMDALEPFHPERVASRILGMGDVLSLVEEAEQKMDKANAEKIAQKIQKGGGFDFSDYRAQLLEMEKMGGIAALMEKLPNMDRVPQKAMSQFDPKQSTRAIAIINSMTPHERAFPAVLRGSRKKRIALGAGVQVQEVNRLLKQFAQMQKMMKRMKKGGVKNMLGQMPGGMPGAGF